MLKGPFVSFDYTLKTIFLYYRHSSVVLGDVNNFAFEKIIDVVIKDDTNTNEGSSERMERGTIIEVKGNK